MKEKNKELFNKIHEKYPGVTKNEITRIINLYNICNNSINIGDCFGETYCENECSHKNFHCKICNKLICNCCYKSCPICTDYSYQTENGCLYINTKTEKDLNIGIK